MLKDNLLAYALVTVVGLALSVAAFGIGPGPGFAVLAMTLATGVLNGLWFRRRRRRAGDGPGIPAREAVAVNQKGIPCVDGAQTLSGDRACGGRHRVGNLEREPS